MVDRGSPKAFWQENSNFDNIPGDKGVLQYIPLLLNEKDAAQKALKRVNNKLRGFLMPGDKK